MRHNYWAASAAIILSLLSNACSADSNEYALPRTLNVGILRIASANQSGSDPTGALLAPYIFDILSHRPDIKPSLWHLVNPLAPATVDPVSSRFSGVYSAGETLQPNMAPYWEVDLSLITDPDQLRPYNLLYIRTDGNISMTITERKVLRQYVDEGGTLWIDGHATSTGGTTFDAPIGVGTTLYNSNVFRVYFNGTAAASSSPSFHPIANSPNTLSISALANLGYGTTNCEALASEVGTGASSPDPTLFQTIGGSLIVGDYGSGHVIIDGLGIGDAINAESATPSATVNLPSVGNQYDLTNYYGAPQSDLQFLVNVLSYATGSSTPGANVRGSGVQGGNLSGALTSSWEAYFPSASADAAVGVATYGKFVYTTDTAGNLSCFDVNPSESLFSDGVAGDDGATDYSKGSSYDMIWQAQPSVISSNKGLSAPVVAQIPVSGVNREVVMVQDAAGNVYGYAADYDPGSVALTSAVGNPLFTLGTSTTTGFPGNPPGPTYYRGEVLAPQPVSGNLSVYNVQNSSIASAAAYTINVGNNGLWTEPLLVASVPSTDGTYDGNEIIGFGVSQQGVQTLEFGSRDEELNYLSGAAGTGSQYSTHAASGNSSGVTLIGAPEDTNSSASNGNWILDYQTDNNNNVFNFPATTTPAQPGAISIGAQPDENIYADYDIQPVTSYPPTRTTIEAALSDGDGQTNVVAGAAVGQDEILYLNVNEPAATTGSGYIEAVREQAPSNAQSTIRWRFELSGTTTTPVTDASGISYAFKGYGLVGAPVVGTNGMVYAIITNGTDTDVLALNSLAQTGFNSPFGNFSVQESDEFGVTQTIPGSRFNNGEFTNYSPGNGTPLAPSLCVPGVLEVTPLAPSGTANQGQPTGQPVPVTISTTFNGSEPLLEWYTQMPVTNPTGLRLIGNYLYFGAENSAATSYVNVAVLADPAGIGLQPDPGTRLLTYGPSSDYRFIQQFPSLLNSVTIPPVGTDKYLVTAGANGFEGFSYNQVLVADSDRLIELDPAGNATWTMDSTQESTNSLAYSTTGTVTVGAGTSVALNRPSTVTQLNTNDFLIADSGNNRVVHVERSGNVLSQIIDQFGYILSATYGSAVRDLEISSFSDPLGLLPVGQPLSLSEPNGVVTWLTYEYAAGGSSPSYIDAHYLIADTGNKRILDIVDRYQQVAGGPSNEYAIQNSSDYHYLNWISHVTDIGGRSYKYVEAEPILNNQSSTAPSIAFPDGSPAPATVINAATAIIGVVGDKNIPQLAVGSTASNLSSTDLDATGSSILLLYYSNGYPYSSTSGNAGYQSGLPFELINQVAFGSGTAPTFRPLHGLRSAIATGYTPSPPALGSFVIADDDGVFSGSIASTTTDISSSSDPYLLDATYSSTSEGWSFLQSDYNNMVSAYDTSYSTQNFAGTSFLPVSAIELPGNNFLIANRAAAGNPNSPAEGNTTSANGFGGNVFLVHATFSAAAPASDALDGPIYGDPANTGPLSAPAFALRTN